jgi:hypothetical protein
MTQPDTPGGRVVTGRFVDQPRVDIILPTRNRPAQTLEAIASVLAQTYERWRLIVVDDASDTPELRRLQRELPSDGRIKLVLHSSPGGAQAARDTGRSYSTARLIAFLDSDDLWRADKLQRQVSLLMAHGGPTSKTIVLGGYQWLTESGATRVVTVPTPETCFTYDNMSCVLVTANALAAAGGIRRTGDVPLQMGEGIDMFIRLFQVAEVLIAPECLALCRDHRGPRNSGQPRHIGAASYAELIRRHLQFLETRAPSLHHRLALRAGWRFLHLKQYGEALRHLAAAVRQGTARERLEVLKVVGWMAARSLPVRSVRG